MNWIFLAASAQLINAVVAMLDKYIVSDEKVLPKPFVYAFYSCILTGAWMAVYLLGLLPLDALPFSVPSFASVESPTLIIVSLSFFAAYTFFIALVSLYSALKHADASDVMPVVGAVAALSSFALAYVLLDQRLSPNYIYGIGLLATGTFLVARMRFSTTVALSSIHSGIFFALHYIAMKGLFNETTFDNGFFWSRVALIVFSLTLLLVPSYIALIKSQTGSTTKRGRAIILVNKFLAGIAAIMLLKATELGEVSVVQALDGLKFVFILIIGMMIGHKTPYSCGEGGCRTNEVIQKAAFIGIITLGFLILFR